MKAVWWGLLIPVAAAAQTVSLPIHFNSEHQLQRQLHHARSAGAGDAAELRR